MAARQEQQRSCSSQTGIVPLLLVSFLGYGPDEFLRLFAPRSHIKTQEAIQTHIGSEQWLG